MHMRKAAMAVAIFIAAAAVARADQPGSDWMSKEQVMEKLTAAGYSNITGLEADDGHWEGKGTKNGKIMEFHVDPHSGALTKEEVDD
ncbi:MAG TPA: PepSY domain-containing protein [Nitrobacter sp.]|nr:PepSY domain-containing protein [Nitrobacter sp.]